MADLSGKGVEIDSAWFSTRKLRRGGKWLNNSTTAFASQSEASTSPLQDFFFYQPNSVKTWDGVKWNYEVPNAWSGAAWVAKTVKYWDGSTWRQP